MYVLFGIWGAVSPNSLLYFPPKYDTLLTIKQLIKHILDVFYYNNTQFQWHTMKSQGRKCVFKYDDVTEMDAVDRNNITTSNYCHAVIVS